MILSRIKRGVLALCGVQLLLGVLIVVFPNVIMGILAYLIGAVLVAFGIYCVVVSKNLFFEILSIITAVIGVTFIISGAAAIKNLLSVVFGLFFIVKGGITLLVTLREGRQKAVKKSPVTVVVSALELVVGLVLFFVPSTTVLFAYLGGGLLIISAVMDTVLFYKIFGTIKDIVNTFDPNEIEDGTNVGNESNVIDVEYTEINDDEQH